MRIQRRHEAYREMADLQINEIIRTMASYGDLESVRDEHDDNVPGSTSFFRRVREEFSNSLPETDE